MGLILVVILLVNANEKIQISWSNIFIIIYGKIVESGFAKEVLENPQSSYTKELLSSVFRIFPSKRIFIN